MDLNDRENIVPYVRGAQDIGDPPNIVYLLNNRQLGLKRWRSPTEFKQFAELKASRSQLQETHCDLPASARSTFLMSFSHDCTKIASTHGDHNIYVSEMKTGRPIKTLEGHPRTPWCIAFHPTSNDILASGCLAGEVRVWDLRGHGSERWRAEHDQVIASLAFHPTAQLLVIATGNSLYFWNWSNPAPDGRCSTSSELERVRYVKFDPLGFRIITGIANLNCGLHTNTCGLASTSFRPHPSYRRQNPGAVDIYRACRRSVMERLMSLPETEILRRQPIRTSPSSRNDRNVASSSRVHTRMENLEFPPHLQLATYIREISAKKENVPLLFDTPTTSSTEFQQTVRTSPEDDLDTASSISSISAERSQSQPRLHDHHRGNILSRNNVESSTDHQNNSLSDHDYFSESNMPQSRVNNESFNSSEPFVFSSLSARKIKEDSDLLQRTVHRLRGLCNDLEKQISRAILQTNDSSEHRAGSYRNNTGSRVLQSNETSEPRAGPSQNDGGSGVGLPQYDRRTRIRNLAELAANSLRRREDDDGELRNPYVNSISDINLGLLLANQRVTSNQNFRQTVWNIVDPTSVSGRDLYRDLLELITDANTSQISTSVQVSPQPSVTTQSLSLLTSSVPEEMHADSSNSTEHSTEMRNSLTTLRDNVERPTVNENNSPSLYNLLNYVKRNRSSHLESNEEISRSKKQKRQQFGEIARGSLEDSSTSQTTDNPQPPVIPHLSSGQFSIDKPSTHVSIPIHSSPAAKDISSSSVTAEAASAAINSEESVTFIRNSPQPRTTDLIPDITDEDLPSVSREETDNHETDRLRAEASTQASSPSDSRNHSQLAISADDMSDDDIFPRVLCKKGQCILKAGYIPPAGPSKPYRLQIEDISDSDDVELTSSPSTSDLDLLNESGSGTGHSRRLSSSSFDHIEPLPSSFFERIEPISDASSDDSDRPCTPPLLMYSQSYNSLLFTGHSRIALNDPLTQNHRIQVWDFTSGEFPPIYDATANIVVRRCMIHNDASVDISQDGEKLVALIPPEERDLINYLMFGVFSLHPGHLGRTLCIWGYISNAISVSFSPLAQYVVVGSAYSRPIYSNPEKAAVAQIIKINKSRDSYDASYIRSFTQVINNDNRIPQVSLNCVRWLPMSGLGIAYATNRGCLCICKPIAGEMFENVPNEPAPEDDRIG